MEIKTILCDVCKFQKKEANHWFKAVKLSVPGVSVYPWEAEVDAAREISHLCGIECVMKWVGRQLVKEIV